MHVMVFVLDLLDHTPISVFLEELKNPGSSVESMTDMSGVSLVERLSLFYQGP